MLMIFLNATNAFFLYTVQIISFADKMVLL